VIGPRTIGALALVWLASPSVAAACACCDGHTERAPRGWSADGRLAVEVRSYVGCESHRYVEVWRPDGARAECFDLHADPARAVACDAPMRDGGEASARRWSAGPFSSAARPLDAGLVRAHLTDAPPTEEGRARQLLTVEVLAIEGWRELLRLTILRGAPETYDEPVLESGADLPIVVGVWPSPRGGRAAVLVRGHDTAPGTGHFDTTVHWVDLPALRRAERRERAPDHWSMVALPAFTAARVPFLARTRAQRLVRDALAHQRGDRDAAAMSLLVEAASVDPSNAYVRYHLARGLARDGQPARAAAVLEALRSAACAACEAALRDARRDPRLAPLLQEAQ